MATSGVYLIRADNNLYKIGQAVHIEKRFKNLQSANAGMLELLWALEVKERLLLERILHWRHSEKRHHGEWFALGKEEVEFIINLSRSAVRGLCQAYRRFD